MSRKEHCKLKGKMTEQKCSQSKLAQLLGISVHSVNSKLNGKTEFTIAEMENIADILSLKDPIDIFFKRDLHSV